MQWLLGLILGLAGGAILAGIVARQILLRQLRAVRAAERRARSAERMAEIGAMTGGLAHEIKNPLSTIGLNAQLLAEAVGDSDASPEVKARLTSRIGNLRRETERLRNILADFLEFAGQLRLDLRPTDMNLAVTELCDFFLPEAERHGVKLTTELGKPPVNDLPGIAAIAAGRPLMAPVDIKLLKQALLNLMLNAVQAMAGQTSPDVPLTGRGTLTIRTQAFTGDHSEKLVRICVIDSGPGMTAETCQSIFVPYFTTKGGGSGLGLPTSRRIAQEHGGKLEVSSEVGRGTTFTMTLPAERTRPVPE